MDRKKIFRKVQMAQRQYKGCTLKEEADQRAGRRTRITVLAAAGLSCSIIISGYAAATESESIQTEVAVPETVSESSAAAETESELKDGQRKAEIQVISILGNELTYIELNSSDETENAAETDAEESEKDKEPDTNAGESQQPNESDSSDSEQPNESGVSKSQQMNRPDSISQTAQGEENAVGSQRPDMAQGSGQMPDSSGGFGMGKFQKTEVSTMTVYLPVKVQVYTNLGDEVSYTILESGDQLEVLFETDEFGDEVITQMWMESTEG